MKFKQFLLKEEGYPYCKFFRKDNETCSIGCKKINVVKNNTCPYTDVDDHNCPCRKS